jgi:hypothetical protein
LLARQVLQALDLVPAAAAPPAPRACTSTSWRYWH